MRRRIRAAGGAAALAVALMAGGAQPASAQLIESDCMVSGGGRLLAANGDPATFGGSAATERSQVGHQVYIDHGPVTPIRFRSLTMTALVCNLDARTAEMIGTGQVDTALGPQLVQYRIAVFDPTRGAIVSDRYRITLSNGYDSGERPVVHGNITIHAR
jgi:hypothetical protein